MSEPIAYILERQCNSCGEMFEVRIDWETDKILTKCFNGGTIRLGIGMWALYRMDKNPDGSIKWVKILPWWKELWYRLIDFKRLILHQYKDVEYWECTECIKRKCEICGTKEVLSICEDCDRTICHREIYSSNPVLCEECFNKRLDKDE